MIRAAEAGTVVVVVSFANRAREIGEGDESRLIDPPRAERDS